jgi:hypothetical protein
MGFDGSFNSYPSHKATRHIEASRGVKKYMSTIQRYSCRDNKSLTISVKVEHEKLPICISILCIFTRNLSVWAS